MKGIMFNLLEEVVNTGLGEQTWDRVLADSGVDGAYTSLGNYPDEEFSRLLGAISRRRGAAENDTLRWFGRQAMPFLAEHYPEFFNQHPNLRSFLLSLNEVIHAEVRKLYPGADVPNFQFETPVEDRDTLVIRYRSKRRLCLLAEGFIAGASDRYGERTAIAQPQCMLDGAAECRIMCRFGKDA